MLEAMVAGQLKTVSIDIHWYLLSIRTGEALLKSLRLTTAAGVTFTKVLMPTQFEMVSDKRIHSKFGHGSRLIQCRDSYQLFRWSVWFAIRQ